MSFLRFLLTLLIGIVGLITSPIWIWFLIAFQIGRGIVGD